METLEKETLNNDISVGWLIGVLGERRIVFCFYTHGPGDSDAYMSNFIKIDRVSNLNGQNKSIKTYNRCGAVVCRLHEAMGQLPQEETATCPFDQPLLFASGVAEDRFVATNPKLLCHRLHFLDFNKL